MEYELKFLYLHLNLSLIHILSEVTEFYDLVIFDDISLFSKVSNEYIREAVEEEMCIRDSYNILC